MKIFHDYAYFYDIFYKDKDYSSESSYVNRLIQAFRPGAKTVLDLGCGTGRHDFCLEKLGYQVVGVDKSGSMLKLAKEMQSQKHISKDKISFYHADIRNFRIPQKFDSVISLFHVTSYMTGNEDVIKMFQTAHKHLKKTGIFIFDLWYGPAVLSNCPKNKTKKYEDDKWKIVRLSNPVIDENKNFVDVHYKITAENKGTKKARKIEEVHTMRYFFHPEIVHFLSDCGFNLLNAEEFLTGQTPGFATWGVAFIARKI